MNAGGGQRGEEERQNGVVDILCRKKIMRSKEEEMLRLCVIKLV